MKIYSLEFLDKEVEAKFQKKEHIERLLLLKLYIFIKLSLAIVEVLFHLANNDKQKQYTQGFLSLASFGTYTILLLSRQLKVSYLANFMQAAQPIINIIVNGALKKSIPDDNLFMYGGFKMINIASLYLIGTDFMSNSFCFLFSSTIYTYTYYPAAFSYNITNFISAIIWLTVIKYISDRDRRNQFLFKNKDEQWTHIMKNMIDDWVVMVNFNQEKDQITIRDANQNFKTSCKVFDDKSFRAFVRRIHVQLSDDTQFKFVQNLGESTSPQQQVALTMDQTHDHDIQINKHPDLESILRQCLLQNDKISDKLENQKRGSFAANYQNVDQKVMKFVGLKLDQVKRRYNQYSIRMIKGSDNESFILLIIKKIKNSEFKKQISNSQIMRNNLVKMSDTCAQYLKLTEYIYNNVQFPQNQLKEISSTILRVSNGHYVHQLYLNQMHDIDQFKFESSISSINMKQMIQNLQVKMKDRILINLKKNTSPNLIVNSFYRELTHLLLIFIENSIKYSNLEQPQIFIEILELDNDFIQFQIKDYGQGISQTSIKNYLDTYKIGLARKRKRILVLDQSSYNIHLRLQMRHGWLAARIILSSLSPQGDFIINSDLGQGCCITFTIYKNVHHFLQVMDGK